MVFKWGVFAPRCIHRTMWISIIWIWRHLYLIEVSLYHQLMYGSFVSAKVFGLMYSYGLIHVSLRCWFSCSLTLAISNQFSEVQIALVARNNLILELAQRILKADERSVWIRTRPELGNQMGEVKTDISLSLLIHPLFMPGQVNSASEANGNGALIPCQVPRLDGDQGHHPSFTYLPRRQRFEHQHGTPSREIIRRISHV